MVANLTCGRKDAITDLWLQISSPIALVTQRQKGIKERVFDTDNMLSINFSRPSLDLNENPSSQWTPKSSWLPAATAALVWAS